jgi:phenylpropionate dioxygenase-like ring-hydroxylating dioxygenase large terminal subunit
MATPFKGVQSEAPDAVALDLRRVGLHPDYWYPLARATDVPAGRTYLTTFGGAPIVLARTEAGELFALDDRCAHRQFPLHKGVVTAQGLRCGYHAWSYRPDGQVAAVPYLPKGACKPDGVRSYACREAYGYVFVFTGAREKAADVPFPDVPRFASPATHTLHFWRRVACHYSFMHENLMDMNHQFLHRGILGSIKPTLLDHERGTDWVQARYRFQLAAGKPDIGARFMLLAGRRRKRAADRGTAGPGDVMTIRTQYPYQTLSVVRGGAQQPSFHLWVAYVPNDQQQRSNVSVGMLTIEKPHVPGLMRLLAPFIRRFTEAVFSEDRMAVEAEQRAYDQQHRDGNQEINPVILDLRDVLRRNGVPISSSASSSASWVAPSIVDAGSPRAPACRPRSR